VNERVVLTIPQKTSGEAKQTSEVSLGLNFPADAQVIRDSFNRSNPATYNKSTAFTVYDNGGNGYLATIYYVKTDNASQSTPFNKWQTYVFVGEDPVNASLVQATDANNQKIYVNQYGQQKSFNEIKDQLTTAKTQLFSFDDLTDKRVSQPAEVTGKAIDEADYNWVAGVKNITGGTSNTETDLRNLFIEDAFSVDIDDSKYPVSVDLSVFKGTAFVGVPITGDMIAEEATNQLISGFGRARPTDEPIAGTTRYGMKVTFDAVNKQFVISSGTTGDQSSITVSKIDEKIVQFIGLEASDLTPMAVETSRTALRGIASLPAVTKGSTPTINTASNFKVESGFEKFIVTVDGIKSEINLSLGEYSVSEFAQALEDSINAIREDDRTDGITPREIHGVKVEFKEGVFQFTSGTTGSDSFFKISGDAIWGLANVEAKRGTTTSWIKPTQKVDMVNGSPQPKFIDSEGNETTSSDGFVNLPEWSPVYLDKGELTFDTGGNLKSPVAGTQLETVYLAGGKGALTINIDYSASTQYSSAFAVLSQSQDGAPEGDLVGVTIGNDGLVSASFSNGTQKSLAKILLANFSSPVGLRQIGDSSFLTSAASGKPILGTPGSAGFGTLRAGATERANVDLTQELVDLITAQRNFQANAKAIETSSTMTSAIINLRS